MDYLDEGRPLVESVAQLLATDCAKSAVRSRLPQKQKILPEMGRAAAGGGGRSWGMGNESIRWCRAGAIGSCPEDRSMFRSFRAAPTTRSFCPGRPPAPMDHELHSYRYSRTAW